MSSDPPFAEAAAASPYTLVAFAGYMIGVFLLGALSHQLLKKGSFLKEYFLGDRQLNAWVLGLTYVATSVSAGSFVGFPSLIYLNGWIMALWIGGYMVGGLVSKGVLAKRLNQVSRLSGAITVPDVLRDRFQSPMLGILAGVFLLLFLVANLIAQFKAGGLILRQATMGVRDSAVYQEARDSTARAATGVGLWDSEKAQAPERKTVGAFAASSVGLLGSPSGPGPLLLAATLYPGRGDVKEEFTGPSYPDYLLGMLIFAITVVAYTAYGGFWAVTWTDVLQGILIVAGAVMLMVLALNAVGGLGEATTRLQQRNSNLVTGPGPDTFLPLGLAVSYFLLWTLGAMGQPVGMVRLMACRDTPTLRRSLFMIGLYFALIYFPLVITFICARALYPTEYLGHSDDIMPAMAVRLTERWPVLGGLILAAPYAAAMSAVAGFLLLMSSSLVRDLYQRNINPNVTQRQVKWVSYGTTVVVGIIVTVLAMRPPQFLQYLILFTGAGMGCTFLAPTVLGLYWRRATRAGALSGLVSGFSVVVGLYVLGWMGVGKANQTGPAKEPIAPVYLLNLDPIFWGLVISFVLAIVVSRFTTPPPDKHVDQYFLAEPTT